jgi:stearoyl-CoA desaturase (delta-9 desaturase)
MSANPLTQGTRLLGPIKHAVTIRNDALRPAQQRIALLTILLPTAGTVAAVAFSAVYGFGWLELGMLLGGFVFGELALEVGFHRTLAHKSFDTYPWVRTFLAVCGSTCAQGRMLHWVANHRRHHTHSDTEDDPHSPHVRAGDGGSQPLGLLSGLWHSHIGHMMTDHVPNCTLFARDINRDPALRRVNDWYGTIVVAGLLVPAAIGWAITGTWVGAVSGFLWGGAVRIFLVQHVTWSVASFSHRFGGAEFATDDQSRNLIWTAIPSFGSGWQNNHHAFPNSAYLGLRWWQPDFAATAIRVMSWVGLAWNLRRPTPEQIQARRLKASPASPSAPPVS